MYLACAFYYPCGVNVSTEWYKSNSGEIPANRERISNHEMDKYYVIQPNQGGTTNDTDFVRCCFATSHILINRFTHSDIGYYQCQIIASNILLQPSPYGHISPSVEMGADSEQNCLQGVIIHHLNLPICTENTIQSISSRVTCTDSQSTTVTTRAYSEIMDPTSVTVTSFSQTDDSTEVISHATRAEENMWVYGTIAGAVVSTTLVVIMFVMSLSIVCWKCKTKQQSKPLHICVSEMLNGFI